MSGSKVLHLWGLNGEPSLVSPESIALCWLLKGGYAASGTVQVVYSNNTDLSPTGELPILIDTSAKITVGLYSIIEHLVHDNDVKLLSSALLQFISEELKKCTMYQLYLNPVNYNEYTSKIYSYLLHWPFWYNTPLSARSRARELCRDIMVTIPEDEENESTSNHQDELSEKATELAQSKVFKITRDSKRQQTKKLQELKNNSRFTTKLDNVLTNWESARQSLASAVLPADLVLVAHLKVQMALPQGDLLRSHLRNQYPSLYDKVNELIEKYDNSPVPNRDPTFSESGNVVTSTCYFLRTFV